MAASPQLPSAHVEPLLVPMPAGLFLMGSASGQDCERPIHRVWIDSFLLASTQVTNEEYAHFLRATSAEPPPFFRDPNFNHPRQPVAGVSWFDADHYCHWLASQSRRPYRLPTEAEWERAARAALEQKDFPWGNAPPQSLPNYSTRWQTGPEQVALYPPNAFGLFNMCDNVHEWCSDWYDPNYYATSPDRNPRGPRIPEQLGSTSDGVILSAAVFQADRRISSATAPERQPNSIIANPPRKSSRGGSWRHHVKVSRCSARSSIPPDFRYADYGFRLACDI